MNKACTVAHNLPMTMLLPRYCEEVCGGIRPVGGGLLRPIQLGGSRGRGGEGVGSLTNQKVLAVLERGHRAPAFKIWEASDHLQQQTVV